MPQPQQSITVTIPTNYNSQQRQEIANRLIEKIIQRTLNGLDVNNRPFRSYKESYIRDSRFAAAGKTAGEVNLKFSREMLNSIQLLRDAPGVLVIGFRPGETNDIAAFNRLPRHGKVRDFLGVRPAELSDVLAQFPLPDPILIGISEGVIDRIISERNEEDNEGNQ